MQRGTLVSHDQNVPNDGSAGEEVFIPLLPAVALLTEV
jgi:hypothetical protein